MSHFQFYFVSLHRVREYHSGWAVPPYGEGLTTRQVFE